MGQSRTQETSGQRIGDGRSVESAESHLSIFLTDFGWFGLLGRNGIITGLTIGHTSSDGVREAIDAQRHSEVETAKSTPVESDWLPEVRRRLESYAAGERVAFGDCRIELPPQTPFQRRVLILVRGIGYGETLTYGDVAAKVGSPPRSPRRRQRDGVESPADHHPLPPRRGSRKQTGRIQRAERRPAERANAGSRSRRNIAIWLTGG